MAMTQQNTHIVSITIRIHVHVHTCAMERERGSRDKAEVFKRPKYTVQDS